MNRPRLPSTQRINPPVVPAPTPNPAAAGMPPTGQQAVTKPPNRSPGDLPAAGPTPAAPPAPAAQTPPMPPPALVAALTKAMGAFEASVPAYMKPAVAAFSPNQKNAVISGHFLDGGAQLLNKLMGSRGDRLEAATFLVASNLVQLHLQLAYLDGTLNGCISEPGMLTNPAFEVLHQRRDTIARAIDRSIKTLIAVHQPGGLKLNFEASGGGAQQVNFNTPPAPSHTPGEPPPTASPSQTKGP